MRRAQFESLAHHVRCAGSEMLPYTLCLLGLEAGVTISLEGLARSVGGPLPSVMALGPSSAHQLLATEPRAERAGLSRTRAAQLECAITARARAPSSKLAQLPRIDLGPCAARALAAIPYGRPRRDRILNTGWGGSPARILSSSGCIWSGRRIDYRARGEMWSGVALGLLGLLLLGRIPGLRTQGVGWGDPGLRMGRRTVGPASSEFGVGRAAGHGTLLQRRGRGRRVPPPSARPPLPPPPVLREAAPACVRTDAAVPPRLVTPSSDGAVR
ncbi:hypothetical protein BKA93DRAFT_827562 [Sparassis latifolia]